MPVDGSLIFDTGIDTDGFEQDAKKLERSADSLGRSVEQHAKEFSDAFRIDGAKKMNSQILKLQNSIKQSQAKIMRLRTELVELENTPVNAKQIENAQEKVREYEQAFFDLLNQREAFEEEFKQGLPEFVTRKEAQEIVENSREWQKMTTQIDKAEKRLEKYEKRLENVLAKEEDPRGTAAYKNRQEQIQKLIDNIAVYEMRIAELSDSIDDVELEEGEGESIFDRLQDIIFGDSEDNGESFFDRVKNALFGGEDGGSLFEKIKEFLFAGEDGENIFDRIKDVFFGGEDGQSIFSKIKDAIFGGEEGESIFSKIKKAIFGSENEDGETESIFTRIRNAFFGGKDKEDLEKKTNGITKAMSKLKKMLLGFGGVFLVFAVGAKLITALRDAAKEGIDNLVQYSDRLNRNISTLQAQMEQLKNISATIFEPIYNSIAPYLESIIDLVIEAANHLAQFTAAVTGQSSYTKTIRQQKDYAASLDETAESADKAGKSLAKYDELNVMVQKTESESVDPKDMFQEAAIDSSIQAAADKLQETLADLWKPFKDSWDEYGPSVIDAAKTALGQVLDLMSAIGESFMNVWTNGTGAEILGLLLQILGNILGIIGNIAEQFRKAWETDGKGEAILQGLADILIIILDHINQAAEITKEWASGINFNPIIEGFQAIVDAAKPLIGTIADGLLWFYENILLAYAKWWIEDYAPAFFNALAAALEVFNAVLQAAAPILEWFWDNFLEPLASWVGGVSVDFMNALADALSRLAEIISSDEDFWTKLGQIGELIVGALIDGIVYAMESIADLLWDVFVEPFLTAILEAFGMDASYTTSEIFIAMGEGLMNGLIDGVGGMVTKLVNKFKEIIDEIKQTVTYNLNYIRQTWNSIFEGIASITNSIMDRIKSIVERTIETVTNAVNKLKSLVDKVKSAASGAISSASSSLSSRSVSSYSARAYSGYEGGIAAMSLDDVSPAVYSATPLYARGTAIPEEAGPFSAKNNILSRMNKESSSNSSMVSAMKEAFRQALEESGIGDVTIKAELDGQTLFESTVKQNDKYRRRTGQSAFVY